MGISMLAPQVMEIYLLLI